MAKMGEPCDCSECMKKSRKPDYLDFDKDGDKEEPMTEALEEVEKKLSLRGNRCSNPDCMAKVQNAGDMCDKCKNKSKGRGFTR